MERARRTGLRTWIAAAVCLTMGACEGRVGRPDDSPANGLIAEVARTSHGIVHVKANDFRSLGYGLAYVYAQDNVCMFADTLLTVRGERSRYFGAEAMATQPVRGEYGAAIDYLHLRNDDSDFFFKGYLDIEQLKANYAAGSQEGRDMLAGYAAGYNRYLRDFAGKLPAACAGAAWVRPITVEDMYLVLAEKALHASGEVFAKEFADAGRGAGMTVTQRARSMSPQQFIAGKVDLVRSSLGSNALGIGRDLTVDGRGILMGNPHYPWTSTDRFYQAHLTVPGKYDAMGVILGGIPIITIGFNKDVAWTHTVTAAVHFTTFRLALDRSDTSGTTYLVDGKPVAMTSRPVTIDVLQADGTVVKRSRTFYFSQYGAVIVKPEAGVLWTASEAWVLGDPNRNNTRLMDQWLAIGRSGTVAELKTALDTVVGLPWVNTVAADRAGDVLYADASVVPSVPAQRFASDCLVMPALLAFDGTRSSCGWVKEPGAPEGIFSPKQAPFMLRTDYVGNSNDSYWLTNPRQLLTGYSPMYGRINVEQMLRTRIGFKQMEEFLRQHQRISMADVEDLVFANRVYAGELVVPDLVSGCTATDLVISAACGALAQWDKKANLDSKGAVLFREFWNSASQIPDKWEIPFNPADPVNTPFGVKPSALPAMYGALRSAALKLQGLGIPLDAPLGAYQDETRNGARYPLHGAIGDIDGSYNSIHMAAPLDANGYHNVVWGTSYVQVVTFDQSGPVAQGMLVYGQSVDPKSPYYADQLPLYSRKEWQNLPFSPDQVRTDPAYRVQKIFE